MEREALDGWLWLAAAMLALAVTAVVAWQVTNRARVGPVRWRVRRRRGARHAILAGCVLAAALVLSSPGLREAPAIAVLALATALLAISPGFQDSAWGAHGVQRGWHARRLRELEAWRLIGEHLRWKLRGEWVATDVPPAEHAALRVELEREAPGRESVHGNAGLDAQRIAAAKSNS